MELVITITGIDELTVPMAATATADIQGVAGRLLIDTSSILEAYTPALKRTVPECTRE